MASRAKVACLVFVVLLHLAQNAAGQEDEGGDERLDGRETLKQTRERVTYQALSPFDDDTHDYRGQLAPLRAALKDAGFTHDKVLQLLDLLSLDPFILKQSSKTREWNDSLPHDALGELVRFFMLRIPVKTTILLDIFGEDGLTIMGQLSMLGPADEGYSFSTVACSPAPFGITICTDLMHGRDAEFEPVMYLGMDSYGLVEAAPHTRARKVLDLCTGSGVQIITALKKYAQNGVAVDLNPRALRFTRFNRSLNNIPASRLQTMKGNLFRPLLKMHLGSFDVILANPPFVPTPDGLSAALYSSGGRDGEAVVARLVREGAAYLTPNGRMLVTTQLVNPHQYEEKLKRWWPSTVPASLFSYSDAPIPADKYAELYYHRSSSLEMWKEDYAKVGVESVGNGYIFAFRHSALTQVTVTHTDLPFVWYMSDKVTVGFDLQKHVRTWPLPTKDMRYKDEL